MKKEYLKISDSVSMFKHVAQTMIDSVDILTKADQVIGDGDHGIGMQRGFEAVLNELNGNQFNSLNDLFKKIGYALMNSSGGASGAIFGTLFIGAARELGNKDKIDANNLSIFLKSGLDAVQKRGKAKPGDKTMVDALEPAAVAAANCSSLNECITTAASAAKSGMEATKNMVAGFGRAKSLGERAIGHPDPGSISVSLILNAMKDYITSNHK